MIELYLGISIVVAIVQILILNLSKDFDKWVHDETSGQIEFTWWDKIVIPLFVGLTWPWAAFVIVRYYIHGR